MIRILILGAGGAAGINFCRALRRAGGIHIIASDVDSRRIKLPSADEYVLMPPAYARETRYPAFYDVLAKYKPDVVYAQADKEVQFLSEHRSACRTMLPSMAALEIAGNKMELNRVLRRRGVAVPDACDFAYAMEWAFQDKLWVRAKCGAGSKAALPCNSMRQARQWVDYWCEMRGLRHEDFMVSEFLPGKEYAWQGVYKDGQLFASVARTRDEYVFADQMPSGQSSTPSVATIVHSDEVNRLAEAAVRAIEERPNGVYGVDCKTGADGVVKVTEINAGRFYTTSDFYAAAGCNLPSDWVHLAMGQFPPMHGEPIPAGTMWIRSLDREPLLVWPTSQPALTLTGLGDVKRSMIYTGTDVAGYPHYTSA